MGKQNPQRQHTLTTEPAGIAVDSLPIQLRIGAEQLGDITKPLQFRPEVLRAMNTEDQEHNLWREPEDRCARHGPGENPARQST